MTNISCVIVIALVMLLWITNRSVSNNVICTGWTALWSNTIPKWNVQLLLSFAHDFGALHFALFCDQIFELQLLTQFLTDFPKVCTMYLPICNLHDWYLIYSITSLF